MRLPLMLLMLLLAPLAGCLDGLDGDEDAGDVHAQDAAPPGGAVTFRCDDPDAACPGPFLPVAPHTLRPSLQDPDRTIMASATDAIPAPLVPRFLQAPSVHLSDDGEAWTEVPLPAAPLRPGEARHSAVGIDAMQDPSGALHVLVAFNVVPGLVGGDIPQTPPAAGFLAYATAPDGRTWQPMVRLLDGGDLFEPRLHWVEDAVWLTWRHEDATAVAALDDLPDFRLLPWTCTDYRTTVWHDSIFVACAPGIPGDPRSAYRIDAKSAESGRFSLSAPCLPGQLVQDRGELWFVSVCDELHISKYNGTGFETVHAVPLADVPSLDGSWEERWVLAADRDTTGTWHLLLEIDSIYPNMANCRCWEGWSAYLAVGPDGTLRADAVVTDSRADLVMGDNQQPGPWDAWARSVGTGTLMLYSIGRESLGFWVDVTPGASP